MRISSCLVAICLGAVACSIEKQPEGKPFSDDFSAPTIGPAWHGTGGGNYRIDKGELVVDHAYNHPLWLSSPLPRDGVVEFDAWSNDPAGDIKIELWGDGKSYATTASYTATSYVFIFGGWHNTTSAIARMNEHGADRKTRSDRKVVPGQKYHFRVERRGAHIDWQIDGQPFLTFDDPDPLVGPDHAYLAINDWEVELHFDNIVVKP
jgi:Farnesoic acid 0-methyl transferase